MKVVPDLNVLLSAVIAPGGTSDQALRVAMTNAQTVVSRHLVERFLARAKDQKFRRWFTMDDANALAERLWDSAEIVADPGRVPRVVMGDPSDDYLVELARAHRAMLLTGDRGIHESIRLLDSGVPVVVDPAAFLNAIATEAKGHPPARD